MANPISKIDDFVEHVHRERNQEADHWANIGSQGQRKIVLDRYDNSEKWKAVKGCWHGSFKDNGKGRQGKMGDSQSNFSPSESWHGCGSRCCRSVRAHEIRDLIFCKCLCAQNVNQCINRILNR